MTTPPDTDAPGHPRPAPDLRELAAAVRRLVRRAYSSCTETVCGADWDVVLTTYDQAGSRVLRWMDEHQVGGCGPVIANHEANSLMWLVPPGTVHEWPVEKSHRPGRGGTTPPHPPRGRTACLQEGHDGLRERLRAVTPRATPRPSRPPGGGNGRPLNALAT